MCIAVPVECEGESCVSAVTTWRCTGEGVVDVGIARGRSGRVPGLAGMVRGAVVDMLGSGRMKMLERAGDEQWKDFNSMEHKFGDGTLGGNRKTTSSSPGLFCLGKENKFRQAVSRYYVRKHDELFPPGNEACT